MAELNESASVSTPPTLNPAIQHCLQAWNERFQLARTKGESEVGAAFSAAPAYRAAMPELTDAANIRDFVACVARGILLGAIDEKRGAKLLYAAQVATGALRHQPSPERSMPADTTQTPTPPKNLE